MRAATVLTTLAGASSGSALMMLMAAEEGLSYDWAVTGWSAGCAKAGCHYDFNVTGEANMTAKPPRPAFKVYCSGQGEGASYQQCTRLDQEDVELEAEAKLLPSNTTTNGTRRANIQISVAYIDLDTPTTRWNYTGEGSATFNQFVSPPLNFNIVPDEITGVAGGVGASDADEQ